MAERQRRARALMAATAALTLAGCSATHVGDDWQCPLAQGKVCASVAAADPAVPETLAPETRAPETRAPLTLAPLTRGTANLAHDIPHYRRGESRIAAGAPAGRGGEPACESDCDPFAWLGSLFAGFADAGPADPGTAISGEMAMSRPPRPPAQAETPPRRRRVPLGILPPLPAIRPPALTRPIPRRSRRRCRTMPRLRQPTGWTGPLAPETHPVRRSTTCSAPARWWRASGSRPSWTTKGCTARGRGYAR